MTRAPWWAVWLLVVGTGVALVAPVIVGTD